MQHLLTGKNLTNIPLITNKILLSHFNIYKSQLFNYFTQLLLKTFLQSSSFEPLKMCTFFIVRNISVSKRNEELEILSSQNS